MITLMAGGPGNGKSLNTARRMLHDMMFGKRIVANFEINPPKRYERKGRLPFYWENKDITVDRFIEFAYKYHADADGVIRKESQTTVIIDECQLIFGRHHLLDQNEVKRWEYFFTQHSKLGYDMILISQADRQIHKCIRELIELETRHYKLDFCPSNKLGFLVLWTLCKFAGITLFYAVTRWYHNDEKEFRTRKFFTYREKYSRVYNRFKVFEAVGSQKKKNRRDNAIPSAAVGRDPQGGDQAQPEEMASLAAEALVLDKLRLTKYGLAFTHDSVGTGEGECISSPPEISGIEDGR